jgi:hypothetical protein
VAAGTPGWVGRRVDLIRWTEEGDRRIEAAIWLEPSGVVACDRTELLARWSKEGIVGRADRGRLRPEDGQAFLDELPFVYQTPYLMAVPRRDEAPE